MFIYKQRKKWLLLHSCRDGSGRVYHRRLGHCTDLAGLERQLDEISLRCPEIRFDRTRLLSKFRSQDQASGQNPAEIQGRIQPMDKREAESPPEGLAGLRSDKLRRTARTLLRLLAEEEDMSVVQGAQEELALLSARLQGVGQVDEVRLHLSRLSPRRRKFDVADPQARPYLEALDDLSLSLQEQGQIEECLAVLERRVECSPAPEVQLRYGAMLQSAGRLIQAAWQYARLPLREPRRHYNLASLAFQQERKEEAMIHLLRGLTHDPRANLHFDEVFGIRMMTGQSVPIDKERPVGPNPEYWCQFGHLWTAEGRDFVQKICSQPLIRFRLRKTRETGVKSRNLVPPSSLKMLLERAAKPDDTEPCQRSAGLPGRGS